MKIRKQRNLKPSKSAFTPARKKDLHESCLANPHVPSSRDVPAAFHRSFRLKPCQAGTFPPDKTLYRKYRIERGGQKLRTASRSVFLSFLTLSSGKIGDGKKYSSGSWSLEQFFFFLIDEESCLRHSEGCGAPVRRSCRVEGPSRFMPGNQWALLLASERDLEWQTR